ncbi:hypothetical protein [Longimicrobium sp.]|uniref:hypothetical protein n=1 Tax=Longimicrobium sp. TaxID=2029185 RepID=UPI002BCD927A|nr:hypothetical protein [Longimicrobium sp.]HSU12663.1 hypothetical protein [Longimicrobium sp.]
MSPATLSPPPVLPAELAPPPVAGTGPAAPVLPSRPPLRGHESRRGGLRVTRGGVLFSVGVHVVLAVLLVMGIDQATRGRESRQAGQNQAEKVSYLDVGEWPTKVPSTGAPLSAAPAAAARAQGVSAAAMDSAVARLPGLQRFPTSVPNGIPAAPRGGGARGPAGAQPGGAPGAGGNAIGGDVAGGPLGAGYGDRRLIVRPEAVPERQKTEHERYMDHLGSVLGTWNDSVAAEAERQRRIHNWTFRDKNGREWGLGQGGVPIIAGQKLPTRIAPPIHVDRDKEESERAQSRQRTEIDRQAEDTDRDRNFRERTRATRQRQDEERRRRQQSGDGSSSSPPSSSQPSGSNR